MIEDFRRLQVDGKWSRSATQDKGHEAQFRMFFQRLNGGVGWEVVGSDALAVTSLALLSLEGRP